MPGVYTPGHCLDHLALALDTGQVFCGDMASSFLLWAGVKYCTLFMTDLDAAYCSWQKVLAAGATRLYPAHGRPFPAEKLRENLGRVKTRDLVRLS